MLWNTVAEAAEGDSKKLTGLRVRHMVTREEGLLEVSGLFYAIGHTPNTAFLGGQLPTDAAVRARVRLPTRVSRHVVTGRARHMQPPSSASVWGPRARATCW